MEENIVYDTALHSASDINRPSVRRETAEASKYSPPPLPSFPSILTQRSVFMTLVGWVDSMGVGPPQERWEGVQEGRSLPHI